MMAADSLPISVHLIVPSDVSFRWPSPCRRVCSAGVDPAYRAPHFAQAPAPSSDVQASCLEHARPVAVAAFAADAQSDSEGQRRKARYKVAAPSCLKTLSARGGGAARAWERWRAAKVRNAASALEKARALHARLRWSWMEAQHEQA